MKYLLRKTNFMRLENIATDHLKKKDALRIEIQAVVMSVVNCTLKKKNTRI